MNPIDGAGRSEAPIRRADFDGSGIAYFDVGRGRALVMVHGWPQHSYAWRRLAARLSGHCRVVALDLPGCGDSDPVESGFDKKSLAGRVRALVEHLGLNDVVIVGHDWGGPIAYRFALDYPELTAAVIVMNGRMPLLKSSRELMYTPQQVRERWYFHLNTVPELPEKMIGAALEAYLDYVLWHWSGDRRVHDADDLAEHLRVLGRPGGLRGGLGLYRTAEAPDLRDWEALSGARILVPHLALWGALDPVLPPAYLDGLETVAPQLEVAVHEEAGHFLAEDRPDWVAEQILRFLGQALPTA